MFRLGHVRTSGKPTAQPHRHATRRDMWATWLLAIASVRRSLWTTAGIACGQCSAPEAAAYAVLSASSRKIVSQEPAVARPASPPPHGLEGHGASKRRDEFPSLPWLYRVRPRRRFGREVSCSKGAPPNA